MFILIGEIVSFLLLAAVLCWGGYTIILRAAARVDRAEDTHLTAVEHRINGGAVLEIVDAEHGVRCYSVAAVGAGSGFSCVKEGR